MISCTWLPFQSYEQTVPELCELLEAGPVFARQEKILIKPNLINDSPPPVTTPVRACRALVEFIRSWTDCEVVIAEGCGAPGMETMEIFHRLGYTRLSSDLQVPLVDLNHELVTTRRNPSCSLLQEAVLPAIALKAFIVSLPVLKAHSLADITGSLKNMLGFAPPETYGGRSGSWKKAFFHTEIQTALREWNTYITPDLTVMDASVGLASYHLGGPPCSPPLNTLLGGSDPYAVDRKGAELLGLDPAKIGHLQP
jgi:uncharacterized protein (DUF362 family)